MSDDLDPDALRAYARRRWDLVAREDHRFRAERYRTGGPQAGHQTAARLLAHWRAIRPGGADPERREKDLAAHIALRRQLDRTRHAF